MKILLKDVLPGTVIETEKGTMLVVYIKEEGKIDTFFGEKPFIEYFSVDSSDTGRGLSGCDLSEKVKVLKGKKREQAIQKVLRETRGRMGYIQRDLEMIDILVTLTKNKK